MREIKRNMKLVIQISLLLLRKKQEQVNQFSLKSDFITVC